MRIFVELIVQYIINEINLYSHWESIIICFPSESIKQKSSINIKKFDAHSANISANELSIINQNKGIDIETLITFTSYLLKCIDNSFKIPELILNGFLEDSLSQIISNIDSKEYQSLNFLRIEGNNKLTLTPAILSSINNFSSLVSP